MIDSKFQSSFEYKLIYVFRINDEVHKGFLKIGDATVKTDKNYAELSPNCRELNQSAIARIKEYTQTAGVTFQLLYTEIAVYKVNKPGHKKDGLIQAFRDHDVHNVLKRSGINNKNFHGGKEWFECDLSTAINAIKAVKENRSSLTGKEVTTDRSPIIFRPEQEEAIKKTLKQYEKGNRMLWNAKMRFGKTLTALEVAKRSSFSRTIIITHRPVVEDGWFEDFNKIFYDRPEYVFGSKNVGEKIGNLAKDDKKFVYFASMQDLRGSEKVGGKFDKNNIIFKIDWDFVVVDEAHEGTQTKLGQDVLKEVIKPDNGKTTKTLELSGTPFNLLIDYEDQEIYTWDYIMEQQAKLNWTLTHFGDSNPYEELPKLNIYTYHLEETFSNYQEVEDKAFNFREFFRVWLGDVDKDGKPMPSGVKVGDFVHANDIRAFLNLICKSSNDSNYPFSTETYRDYFRHTLWVVPGVREAKALSALLKAHPVFSQFEIVNVAGEGDEEIDTSDALNAVRKAMTKHPEDTRTITISCGRLTTGVTVPEWTAVLMLAGSYSTAATQYLQTIFRVQSPANINGKIKENCYVFDFAPDRTLMMVAESVQLSQRGMGSKSAELRLGDFLNFCPVISISQSVMQTYKVSELLQQLKKAYVERVVKNGFDDNKLYNDELLKLDDIELKEFDNLKGIIGQTKSLGKTNNIDINDEGFTEEEYEKIEKAQRKPKKQLTEEEKKLLEEKKKRNKQKLDAISILRGISIRIPLLVYGADVPLTKDITVDEFPNLVDDLSWSEFMPKGVTKELFAKFGKYYDKDVFIASTYRIRAIAKSADELAPTERIVKIAQLFSTFRNPDKETVLTPWRVVNMHMSDTIGGYDFFDENHEVELDTPRLVEQEGVTNKIFINDGKVLEVNSKTGLYPLYIAYTFYRHRLKDQKLTLEEKLKQWDEVIKTNVFVICKTPMAKSITRRTLLGYREGKFRSHAFDDLINQMKEKQQQFIQKVTSASFWGLDSKGGNNVKFNAIVGNPPYQAMDGGAQSSSIPIYNEFVLTSKKLEPDFISLIMPSRWMTSGKGLDSFRFEMIHDKRIEILHDYIDAKECFDNVEIKGGICYFLWNKKYNDKCSIYTHYNDKDVVFSKRFLALDDDSDFYVRDERLLSILNKVKAKTKSTFNSLVSSRKPYGLTGDFFKNPSKYGLPPVSDVSVKNGYRILGLGDKQKREYRYIDKNYPLPKTDGLFELKIFIPESYGNGMMGEGPSNPIIGHSGDLCLETFLQIRPIKSIQEANNIISYMKTKIFRLLVGIIKNTQHGTQKVYRLVPIMGFDNKWDDASLYKFFDLDEQEICFINELIG